MKKDCCSIQLKLQRASNMALPPACRAVGIPSFPEIHFYTKILTANERDSLQNVSHICKAYTSQCSCKRAKVQVEISFKVNHEPDQTSGEMAIKQRLFSDCEVQILNVQRSVLNLSTQYKAISAPKRYEILRGVPESLPTPPALVKEAHSAPPTLDHKP